MPKEACVGGQLWELYSKKVRARMDNPVHRGEITADQAKELGCELVVVDWGAEACGDAVTLYWALDRATNTVRASKFYSFGCGTAIASSDMMCELCEGRTVDDVMKITNLVVEQSLRDAPDKPAVPPQKMHCSVMAQDVLRKAVAACKGVSMESLEDSELVCACARVTVGLVKEAVRRNNLTTVEQITQYTKAGAFCKSCVRPGGHEKKKYYLEDLLRQTRAEMAREKLAASRAAAAKPVEGFRSMNIIRKGNVIQSAIDEHVAPVLEADGGTADVVDVRESADGTTTDVFIEYGGACVGCQSAHGSTLTLIQEMLQRIVDPSIHVLTTN